MFLQQVDMKNVFHFQLSSLSPVHHSHINSFCQSHKQFSCPPPTVYLVIVHFLREGSHKNDRWGGEEKDNMKKDFFGLSQTHREKRCYSAVYLVSLPYRSTDNNEQVQAPIAGRWQEMKMSEGVVWEIRAFLFSVLLSVCLYLSLCFLSPLPMMMWQGC